MIRLEKLSSIQRGERVKSASKLLKRFGIKPARSNSIRETFDKHEL